MAEAPQSALATLLLPFEQGAIAAPDAGRGLFINAMAGPALTPDWRERLVCVQPFKPLADALVSAGFTVDPVGTAENQQVALLLMSAHKRETRARVAAALACLQPGGHLVIAGGNAYGPKSLERALADHIGVAGTLVKNHARVFWLIRPDPLPAICQEWAKEGDEIAIEGGQFHTLSGLFSADSIDAGSALLAAHLPPWLSGEGADLGAGWGFLSAELLARCPGIRSLTLFEADSRALALARRNLARVPRTMESPAFPIHDEWCDVTRGIGKRRFDHIVMNPPFHEGKADTLSLGLRFIAVAGEAIKPGGHLVMVANRHLPYAESLARTFRRVQTLAQTSRYVVSLAQR